MSKNQIKETVRQTCINIRRSLSTAEQRFASNDVCARIQLMEPYQQAKYVALYRTMHGEIDLSSLWTESKNNLKTYFFPIIQTNKTLSFVPVTNQTSFHKNSLGILEPDVPLTLAIHSAELDIIFMPLVAFDEQGSRIGMGGGYYDRTLMNNSSSLLIGVAYDFQKQPIIQPDPWDIPLDAVITQSKIYWTLDKKS